jgi:Bacterial PH domain
VNAVFRSKIDGTVKCAALLLPCVALLALFTAPRGNDLLLIPIGLGFLATALVCWILLSTCYELQVDSLVVRCGPCIWRIPLAEVTDIRESNSVRSAPALSMDRLEVVYGGGRTLIISPADKERFVAALQRRAVALSPCRKASAPHVYSQ